MIKFSTQAILMVSFMFTTLFSGLAQTITTPRVSQQAMVAQRIGLTDISIVYHSPAANKRTVWGALVPFDQIWRAGANENTIITFSDDVQIEGKNLKAGSYGLYMTPHANSVDVIFSSATKNWGTVPPTAQETVITVTVTPQTSPHQEWMSFDFANRGGNEVTAQLKWADWTIPFTIAVDVPTHVINNIREELKGLPGFGYLGREQAARYCLTNNIALDEAMTWIDGSINAEKRFSNMTVKSGLLNKSGDTDGGQKVMEEALTLATPVQMNLYGYQLLNSGDVEGAKKIFLKNVANTPKTHSFYWGFIDSIGEAYLKSNDLKNALKYYSKAKEHAPANRHAYLDGVLKGIKDKM